MQFYNQGLYGDCTGLLTKSGGAFPGSSLFEIPKHGIPLNKLVIGKPAKNVSEAEALDYVLAYTAGNDVSISPFPARSSHIYWSQIDLIQVPPNGRFAVELLKGLRYHFPPRLLA